MMADPEDSGCSLADMMGALTVDCSMGGKHKKGSVDSQDSLNREGQPIEDDLASKIRGILRRRAEKTKETNRRVVLGKLPREESLLPSVLSKPKMNPTPIQARYLAQSPSYYPRSAQSNYVALPSMPLSFTPTVDDFHQGEKLLPLLLDSSPGWLDGSGERDAKVTLVRSIIERQVFDQPGSEIQHQPDSFEKQLQPGSFDKQLQPGSFDKQLQPGSLDKQLQPGSFEKQLQQQPFSFYSESSEPFYPRHESTASSGSLDPPQELLSPEQSSMSSPESTSSFVAQLQPPSSSWPAYMPEHAVGSELLPFDTELPS